MLRARVSSKFQVVIPRGLRKRYNIRKGQEIGFIDLGNRIQMVPDRDISEMEGIFPGLSIEGIREEEDRI